MYNSRHIPHLFTVITVAVLAISCSEHSADRLLASADSLMNTRPDSAYSMLDSLSQQNAHASESLRMRIELLKAKAQNKAYIDFTTDSVMLEAADYFDHHGTPNDRMLAHYLLGCTYRDMKEAPMSLQCYYDAVEAADTTSADCDYITMMSIWGQIASIHENQCMPKETLEALKKYQKYALLSGDTLNYIRGLQHRLSSYCLIGDTANILKTTEEARQLYLKYGYISQSAMTLPSAIYVWLNRHDYSRVHKLQQIYETQSCLFDEYGNIAKGKEHYYYGKGMYYEGIGKLDSAEYFYRKLFNAGHTFDACNGLTRIYAQIRNIDSVLYYSLLKDTVSDKLQTDLHAEAMYQVKGMYDYTRNQKIAHQKELEAQQNKLVLYAFIVAAIIVALLVFSKYRKYKNKKSRELASLNSKYSQAIQEIESANEELRLLETDSAKLQARKRAEISRLKEKLHDYEAEIARMSNTSSKETFLNSDIVMLLKDDKRMAKARCEISDSEWDELQS
ncbi:MAG: hypothetical protein KBS99_02420, partial [Prevotellaceae bacterium]|nr:hypothetical protein [Candidatus Colivivens caballi]